MKFWLTKDAGTEALSGQFFVRQGDDGRIKSHPEGRGLTGDRQPLGHLSDCISLMCGPFARPSSPQYCCFKCRAKSAKSQAGCRTCVGCKWRVQGGRRPALLVLCFFGIKATVLVVSRPGKKKGTPPCLRGRVWFRLIPAVEISCDRPGFFAEKLRFAGRLGRRRPVPIGLERFTCRRRTIFSIRLAVEWACTCRPGGSGRSRRGLAERRRCRCPISGCRGCWRPFRAFRVLRSKRPPFS